ARVASFVVLVPQIPASATKTIYMYYGNAAALSSTSGSRVFNFYDGLERVQHPAFPQVTPTYDGSGQAVHPDVVSFPNAWHGYRCSSAVPQSRGGNDRSATPSILASTNGSTWAVPAGVANPLVPTPPCDHNNDTDMLYDAATDSLWMYYLETRRASRC